jgi:hypothetical protein
LKKIVKQKTHAGVRASRARETNRRLSMLDDRSPCSHGIRIVNFMYA